MIENLEKMGRLRERVSGGQDLKGTNIKTEWKRMLTAKSAGSAKI